MAGNKMDGSPSGLPDASRLKFRAWDPINKRFYKAPFIAIDEYGAEAYEDAREWEDGIRRGSILLQWTGLKDKNGRDIYDGDILTAGGYPWMDNGKPNYRALVVWGNEAMFLAVKVCVNPAKRGISDGIAESLGEVEDWEVLGNFYEHPGLLAKPGEAIAEPEKETRNPEVTRPPEPEGGRT